MNFSERFSQEIVEEIAWRNFTDKIYNEISK